MIQTPEFLEKLRLWAEAKGQISVIQAEAAKQLEPLQNAENTLREELYALAFPNQSKEPSTKGTFWEDLPNGWKIKAEAKLTATLDEDAVPAIKAKLLEMQVSNVDVLFKYKPSLVAAEFKKLNDASKAVVNEAITEKPAKVTITLVEPKLEEF